MPLVGVLFTVPLLTVGALALKYPRMRFTLMAIPMPLLIGINALRLLGVLFLLLAATGRLGGPFPFFCRLGRHHHRRVRNSARIERGSVSKAPGGRDHVLEYFWDTRPLCRRWARHHLSSRKPTTADSCWRRVGGDAVLTILPGTYCIGAVLPDHPRDHCGPTQCATSSVFRPSAHACRCVTSGHAFSLLK